MLSGLCACLVSKMQGLLSEKPREPSALSAYSGAHETEPGALQTPEQAPAHFENRAHRRLTPGDLVSRFDSRKQSGQFSKLGVLFRIF